MSSPGASVQLYHFSQILLQTTRPSVGGFKEIVVRERLLNTAVDTISGIALTMGASAAAIMSSGCVFVAGMNTKHPDKRKAIMDILGQHKEDTGFPLHDFRDELQGHWTKSNSR